MAEMNIVNSQWCVVCEKEIINNEIKCSLCKKGIHRKCIIGIKKKYLSCSREEIITEYCCDCKKLFPFYNLDNEELSYVFLELNRLSDLDPLYRKCYKYNNVDFLQPNEKSSDFDVEFNPDNNIYLNTETDCSYIFTEQTNNFLKTYDGLLIMQINYRSLNKKIDKLDNLIDSLDNKPNIISIAETWLKTDTPLSPYSITGYTIFNSPRTLNKSRGGGVALYVDTNLDAVLMKKFTGENNNFACIGISIKSSKNRITNVISLYRPPDTGVDNFTEEIEDLLKNHNQQTYVCGDFNINLLKYKQHDQTDSFVNKMFSLGYKPLTNKPTRITAYSSTLIDNIFPNDLDYKHKSGIVITDISDHLFIITSCSSVVMQALQHVIRLVTYRCQEHRHIIISKILN